MTSDTTSPIADFPTPNTNASTKLATTAMRQRIPAISPRRIVSIILNSPMAYVHRTLSSNLRKIDKKENSLKPSVAGSWYDVGTKTDLPGQGRSEYHYHKEHPKRACNNEPEK